MTDRWNHLFDDDEQGPTKPVTPKKAGRPVGVRNRTPEERMMQGKLETLFKRIEHMLDPEQRAYLQDVVKGKVKFDALKEAELLIRYISVYTSAILESALTDDGMPTKASQDVAKVLAEYRMGIKDIEEMTRKREEMKLKTGENEQLVDATRKSPLARFESIHGGGTS